MDAATKGMPKGTFRSGPGTLMWRANSKLQRNRRSSPSSHPNNPLMTGFHDTIAKHETHDRGEAFSTRYSSPSDRSDCNFLITYGRCCCDS